MARSDDATCDWFGCSAAIPRLLLFGTLIGCGATSPLPKKQSNESLKGHLASSTPAVPTVAKPSAQTGQVDRPPEVIPAVPALPEREVSPAYLDPFAGTGHLEVDHLVAEVMRANPSLKEVESAWEAASELYDQATAIPDPKVRLIQGPNLFSPGAVPHEWGFQVYQGVPWFGKRGLRGDMALFEAEAASQELLAARLRLVEAAKTSFFDYLVLDSLWELWEADRRILEDDLQQAGTMPAGEEPPDHVVGQAQLDRLELARRQEQLRRAERLARGAINALLHRPPEFPLPRAYHAGQTPDLPDMQTLRAWAIAQRPELSAAQAQVRSRESALALAYKDYFPDVEILAHFYSTWDQLWLPSQANFRPLFGIQFHPPVSIAAHQAATREADARVSQARAQFDKILGQVDREVHDAYKSVEETERYLSTFPEIFSACQRKIGSLEGLVREDPAKHQKELQRARREFITYRVQQIEAWRDYQRRLAELERAVGGPL